MFGEKKLKEIAKKVLGLSKADLSAGRQGQTSLRASSAEAAAKAEQGYGRQAEVLIVSGERGLTRFANSQIHQNVAEQGVWVQVRVAIKDKPASRRSGCKIGVASTNDISSAGLAKVVDKATQMAKLNKIDPHFVSLPTNSKKPSQRLRFGGQGKILTPIQKAKVVGDIIRIAKSEGLTASGAFDTNLSEIAVANSQGVWAYHVGNQANLQTVFLGKTSSGFAQHLSSDSTKIDHIELAKRAANKAKMSKKPIDIELGDYEVILEPPAVAEMMLFFSYLGPNARIYHEEASFLTGKLGKKLFSEKLTVYDDPLHTETIIAPFDYEGHPKSKLSIIEKGVLKNIVYDSYHAAKHGGKNTGHALPAPNTEGPIPTHLVFEPGDMTLPEMIKNVKKGILVTRFWYVRMLHHKLLNITGMTRDGTFLIENGEIVGAVKNLRFTQSIPEALANVISVGRDLKLEEGWAGANLVPALHISNFHFSGVTQF